MEEPIMRHAATLRIALPVAVATLLCAIPVFAQTPDGETPSAETVCDFLKDAQYTPGLYGLCVAFCEALDSDDFEPLGECNVAPMKILENYNKKRGEGDPEMPCLRPECPCFSVEDLLALNPQWCTIGFFMPDIGCLAYEIGWKESGRIWRAYASASAMCYYKDKHAAITLTEEELDSCLAVFTEARGSMLCEKRDYYCKK
jgi:hypothetical protein